MLFFSFFKDLGLDVTTPFLIHICYIVIVVCCYMPNIKLMP